MPDQQGNPIVERLDALAREVAAGGLPAKLDAILRELDRARLEPPATDPARRRSQINAVALAIEAAHIEINRVLAGLPSDA